MLTYKIRFCIYACKLLLDAGLELGNKYSMRHKEFAPNSPKETYKRLLNEASIKKCTEEFGPIINKAYHGRVLACII